MARDEKAVVGDRGQAESVEWRVSVGDQTTSAVLEPAEREANSTVFVCAHGAGGNMNDRGIVATAKALRDRDVSVVRFNFLYKEKKSGRPDPMPRLKECITAVVARVREEVHPEKLILGGRSMGGRAASMLAADGFDCDGLLLLAYPLHPPGKPDQLRDAHLPAIKVPVICFNGTRDPFCTPSLMEKVLARVTTSWEMHWVDGADHSFHVPKSSGRTDAAVLNEIADKSAEWVKRITSAHVA
jgi:predicted alpha/beta-hydrolase family hydrolase